MQKPQAMNLNRRKIMTMGLFSWLTSMLSSARSEQIKFRDVNQFRDFVVARLKSQRPSAINIVLDPNDPAVFSANVNGQDSTNDLTNLFGYINSYQQEDVIALVDRHIRTIGFDVSADEGNIVAVIRTNDYLDHSQKRGIAIVSEHLVGDLNIVYMIDGADAMVPINEEQTLGKNVDELRSLALGNVRKWLPKVVHEKELNPIRLYYVEDNTYLSVSLILLDEFWASVSDQPKREFYFAIPRRDQLFLLDQKDSDTLPAFRNLIRITLDEGFNLLSPNVYRYSSGKIEIISD
jgi:uncharacterized protein YtpQ (UPF0354 family)